MAKVLDLTGLQYFYNKLKTVFALKGEVGVKGDKGDQGVAGKAATIRVGTVSSGSAPAVTNAGTENAAVLNFTLQKGDKGDRGLQGATGAAGTAATITIGNVTSGTTAKVTNRGNANAAILDFVLPKGDKGDAGSAANIQSITNSEIDAFVK